jgi:hypothetical protein
MTCNIPRVENEETFLHDKEMEILFLHDKEMEIPFLQGRKIRGTKVGDRL